MKMLVFETFYCAKNCADGSLRKFKLSFVGDEDLYYTTVYERTDNTEIIGKSLYIRDKSVSADYNVAYEAFKKEKDYLLGAGFIQCKSMEEK